MAAEIGQVRMLSHIGQNLRAEVDLTALTPEEQQALQVRLAVADTYRLANIRRNPVLNSVRLQVRQQEQRATVLLQSSQPVQDNYLNLYLELGDGKSHVVRALTLWLEADPNQASASNGDSNASDEEQELPRTLASRNSPPEELPSAASHANGGSAPDTPPPSSAHLPATPAAVAGPHTREAMPPPDATLLHGAQRTHATAPTPAAHTSRAAAKSPNCQSRLQSAELEAQRCATLAQESDVIAGQLDVMEDRVNLLKQKILAAPPPPPVAAAPAAAMPMSSKKSKATPAPFPWRIVLISLGVFFSVAVLAFMLLMWRSKHKAAKGKGKPAGKALPKPANEAPATAGAASEAAGAPQAESGAAADAAASDAAKASVRPGWRGKLDKIGAKFALPFKALGRLGRSLRSLPAGMMAKLRAKLPSRGKAKAAAKPDAEAPAA